jgi:hypothetical protein
VRAAKASYRWIFLLRTLSLSAVICMAISVGGFCVLEVLPLSPLPIWNLNQKKWIVWVAIFLGAAFFFFWDRYRSLSCPVCGNKFAERKTTCKDKLEFGYDGAEWMSSFAKKCAHCNARLPELRDLI